MSFIEEILKKSGQKDDALKILRALIDNKDISAKTDLTSQDIPNLTQARVLSYILKTRLGSPKSSQLIDIVCNQYMIYRNSYKRKSRIEVTEVLKAMATSDSEDKKMSLTKKLLGS